MMKGKLITAILRKLFFLVGVVCTLSVLFTSCTSYKQLRYFNDLPDSTVVHLPTMRQQERQIQYGDMVSIIFSGRNEESVNFFNRYGGPPTAGGGSGKSGATYMVDLYGDLEFPLWGKIRVLGMTNYQLEDTLKALVSTYLKDPIVTVRFPFFKFTVLGEVKAPGVKTIEAQRTTFLDVLAAAGDLPMSAKRYDISIYRDYNEVRTITKIDLRKKDILLNPDLFQIKHNDVIIVRPREVTFFLGEAKLYTGLIAVILGFITLAVTLSRRYS